ncbi:MAG: discoidin domain-containing protein [Myxococcota bacterium]
MATRLSVSTTTPSLRSGPRFLLDGNPATSWASHRGDDDAVIEFELPTAAKVERLEMTAGFTQRVDGHDRFTENLRITRVRVQYLDRVVEVNLDPERRDLQPINIQGGGGRWRIEILETIPGTRRNYREVCVSELRAIGRAPQSAIGGNPTLYLGGFSEGTPVDDIAQARVDVANVRGRVDTLSGWSGELSVLFDAYPMRCGLPGFRRRVERHLLAAQGAAEGNEDAHADFEWLRCPGEFAALDEVYEGRRVARDAMEAAAHNYETSTIELSAAFDSWSEACLRRLGPDDPLRWSDEKSEFFDAAEALSAALARLEDAVPDRP